MPGEPGIGDLFQDGNLGGDLFGMQELERQPLAIAAVESVAQAGAFGALQIETGEVDMRRLAEFERTEAGIGIEAEFCGMT